MIDETFDNFISKAQRLGICDAYSGRVKDAGSKKQFIDLALEGAAAEWFCHSVAKGWGLTKDYIREEFSPFLNGRYVLRKDGYTSAIYCGQDEVEISTTLSIVIGGSVTVKADGICEVHAVDAEITILGRGKVKLYLYNSILTNKDNHSVQIIQDYNE